MTWYDRPVYDITWSDHDLIWDQSMEWYDMIKYHMTLDDMMW